MKKRYYVSGIYFTKSIKEISSWLSDCNNSNVVFRDSTLLKRFRSNKDNQSRAKFISMLVDEELEALVKLVNIHEYFCISNIIKRLFVFDHKSYIEDLLDSLHKGKKKFIEKEIEALVGNKLTKIKIIREVVSFE